MRNTSSQVQHSPSGERRLPAPPLPANVPASGPALSFGGSSSVSSTLADVIGERYELRGAAKTRTMWLH